MDLKEFQKKCLTTDQFNDKERSMASSIWNLTETVGIISRLYDLWNDAIIQGYSVWRETFDNNGGFIDCDFTKRTIKYRSLK